MDMWPANNVHFVFGCICLVQLFVFAVSQHVASSNQDLTKDLGSIKILNKQIEDGSSKQSDDSLDFQNSDTSENLGDLSEYDKRALDRYSFFGGLGKRGLDRYSFYGGLGKRALDKFGFLGGLGKRALDRYGFFGGLGKRSLDRYGFSGSLGKRKLDRYSFMGGIGKRNLDRYGFAGSLGKRALDTHGFSGSLGKRKLDKFGFMGGLGKRRLDSHRFVGGIGKRALDRYGFFGGLGKRADSSSDVPEVFEDRKSEHKRLYPYWYYRQGGRPILTQTRGIDRFSFAARLGKR